MNRLDDNGRHGALVSCKWYYVCLEGEGAVGVKVHGGNRRIADAGGQEKGWRSSCNNNRWMMMSEW